MTARSVITTQHPMLVEYIDSLQHKKREVERERVRIF